MPALRMRRLRLRLRRLPRGLRRAGLWAALPLGLVLVLYGGARLLRVPIAERALAGVETAMIDGTGRLGFVVTDIEVIGRETTKRATIFAALGAARGTPMLAVSPSRAKAKLESLPWVRSALIERRFPGTIYVRLVERRPLAVWQHDGRQQLIDREGAVIPVTNLAPFASLPTIVGADAASHAASLLDMLASEPDLARRVTAAVRIGDRRWNVQIDGAITVRLPEDAPEAAWARLARLESRTQVLKRTVSAIDLRLPDRIVVRVVALPKPPTPPARKGRPEERGGERAGDRVGAKST